MRKLLLTLLCILFVGALGRAQLFTLDGTVFKDAPTEDNSYNVSWKAEFFDTFTWEFNGFGHAAGADYLQVGAAGISNTTEATMVGKTRIIPRITQVAITVQLVASGAAKLNSATLYLYSDKEMTDLIKQPINSSSIGTLSTTAKTLKFNNVNTAGAYYKLVLNVTNNRATAGSLKLNSVAFTGSASTPGWSLNDAIELTAGDSLNAKDLIEDIPEYYTGEFTYTLTKDGEDVEGTDGEYTNLRPGEYELTVTSSAVDYAYEEQEETVSFEIYKGYPELTWSEETFSTKQTSGVLEGAPTLAYTPELDEIKNAIEYSSSDENVATVSATGEITIVGPGVTIITATFPGNDEYEEATAEYTLTVEGSLAAPTLTPAPQGAANAISFTLQDTDRTVTFSCKDEEGNDVEGVTFHYSVDGGEEHTGNSVSFDHAGDFELSVYAEKDGVKSNTTNAYVSVSKVQPTVTFAVASQTAFIGETMDVQEATVNGYYPESATPEVTYTVTGNATITDGKITLNGTGTVTVRATVAGNDDNLTANGSYTITVNKYQPVITFTGEGLVDNEVRLTAADAKDKVLDITATVADASGDVAVKYEAVQPTGQTAVIGTVAEDGKVTLNGNAGSLIVKASIASDTYNDAASATYTIVVGKAQPTLTVISRTVDYKVATVANEELDPKAIIFAGATPGTKATWEIADSNIGSVNDEGKLTLNVGITGTTIVTATFVGDANNEMSKPVSASYTLNVTKYTPTLAFADGEGEDVTYSAEEVNAEGFTPVSYKGVVTSAAVNVSPKVVYAAAPATVGSVDEEGNVTLTGVAGTLTVTISTEADEYFAASTPISYTITVDKAAPKITVIEEEVDEKVATVADGKSLPMNFELEGFVGDVTPTYAITRGNTIATVNTDGIVTLLDGKTGDVTVTASYAGDDKNAAVAAVSYYITVSKYVPTITVSEEAVTYTADYTDTLVKTLPTFTFENDGYEGLEHKVEVATTGNITEENIIDGELNIYPNSNGTYSVTESVPATAYNDAATATYTITVKPAPYDGMFNFTDGSIDWTNRTAESALVTLRGGERATVNKDGYLNIQSGTGGSITISVPNTGAQRYKITGIEFTGVNSDTNFSVTPSNGTLNKGTWTPSGDVSSVIFTATGATNISVINVTFEKNIPSVITELIGDATNVDWTKEAILVSNEPVVTETDAIEYIQATLTPAGVFRSGDDQYFDKEGETWASFTRKMFASADAYQEAIENNDSWIWEGATIAATIDTDGKLSITVPCSGTYRVTLTAPEGHNFKAETKSFNVSVYPNAANAKMSFNDVEILPVMVNNIPTGQKIVAVVGGAGPKGDITYSRDKVTFQTNIFGADMKYATSSSTSSSIVRRADSDWMSLNDVPMNLDGKSSVAVQYTKNGLTAATEEYAAYPATWENGVLKVNGGDISVGVEGINALDADAEYYTLDGVRIDAQNLVKGIYIMRRGGEVKKIMVR